MKVDESRVFTVVEGPVEVWIWASQGLVLVWDQRVDGVVMGRDEGSETVEPELYWRESSSAPILLDRWQMVNCFQLRRMFVPGVVGMEVVGKRLERSRCWGRKMPDSGTRERAARSVGLFVAIQRRRLANYIKGSQILKESGWFGWTSKNGRSKKQRPGKTGSLPKAESVRVKDRDWRLNCSKRKISDDATLCTARGGARYSGGRR